MALFETSFNDNGICEEVELFTNEGKLARRINPTVGASEAAPNDFPLFLSLVGG